MAFWQWYILIGLLAGCLLLAIRGKAIWDTHSETGQGPLLGKALRDYAFNFGVALSLWPLGVAILIHDKWSSWRSDRDLQNEDRIFTPSEADLIAQLSIPDIETNELVNDPLEGAPLLPFGHLNASWRAFLAGLPAGAEYWSYVATWENRWRIKEQREGYVAVVSGKIGPIFETVRYQLDGTEMS